MKQYDCEKHKINSPHDDDFILWECPKCVAEFSKKGFLKCDWCGQWYKPNKRLYFLCDPEKHFRYKEPTKKEFDGMCGRACSEKCQIDHDHWEWDTGPYVYG